MVCGIPIVAPNVDAIPNIMHDGVNGMLIDKDNIQLVAKIIEKLFINTKFKQDMIRKWNVVKEKYNAKRVWHEKIVC